jgi:hypothetical protein
MNVIWKSTDPNIENIKQRLDLELGNRVIVKGTVDRDMEYFEGFKVLETTNLNGIFQETQGETTWYLENGDVKCFDQLNDGTAQFVYRVLKDNVEEETFLKAAAKSIDDAIEELTWSLGDMVADILNSP